MAARVLRYHSRLLCQLTASSSGRCQQRFRPLCSAASAVEEPATTEPVAEPENYIPGRADTLGTSKYSQRIKDTLKADTGHFRHLKVGGQVGNLLVSSIGIGTFGGNESEEVDRDYIKTITKGFELGINLVDTASNYRSMHSERAVGRAIAKAINEGIVKRNEVIVCTKGGYLSYDYRERVDPQTHVEEKYVKSGLFQWDEFVGGVHCLSTPFIMNQLETSRRNLGLQTIDVYFVHNPEIELGIVSRQTVLSRLKNLFIALEKAVEEGKISMYGISTWNAFRVTSGSKNYLNLEELVNFAKEAAGSEDHHFKVLMVPFNLHLQEIASTPVQNIKGRRLPLLHAAAHLDLNVVTSAPFFQGTLVKGLSQDVKDKLPELGDVRSDAQCALQFCRNQPGVLSTIVGMSKLSHLEENAAIIQRSATYRG